jgi:small-conductance mechanosensitive channel
MRSLAGSVLFTCLWLSPWPARCAQTDVASPPAPETQALSSPVILSNRVLIHVRGIKAITASQRAAGIAERLTEVARQSGFRPEAVVLVETDISTDIVAGSRILLSVYDEDAHAEGRNRQELAADWAARVRSGIEQRIRDYSARNILTGAGWAALLTLALVMIISLIRKFHRKVDARLLAWFEQNRTRKAIGAIRVESMESIRLARIQETLAGALRTGRLVTVIVIVYLYLNFALRLFPWTRNWSFPILRYLLEPLKTIGQGTLKHLPGIFFVLVLAVVTRYVLRLIKLFFYAVEHGTITLHGFDQDWSRPTYKLVRFLVLALAVVAAYPYIPGSSSPAFQGISVFLGLLLSLGSTGAVSNAVAGSILTYMRSFKIGDVVEIAGSRGVVLSVTLLVTRLRTPKNVEIVIPNSMVLSNHVTNYSLMAREKRLILPTTVTIGYDTPWRQVHALLTMAAERTAGVLRDPEPFVLQKSLDDFFVTYELNVHTDAPIRMLEIYSDLHQNIQDVFNEYEVQIMSPHYEADRKAPAVVPRESWYKPPAQPPADQRPPGS